MSLLCVSNAIASVKPRTPPLMLAEKVWVKSTLFAWRSLIFFIFNLDYVVILGHCGDGVGDTPPQFQPLPVCAFVPRAIGTATDGTAKYLRHTLLLRLSSLPPPYGAGSRDRTCSSLRGWSWLSCLAYRLRCRTQSSYSIILNP